MNNTSLENDGLLPVADHLSAGRINHLMVNRVCTIGERIAGLSVTDDGADVVPIPRYDLSSIIFYNVDLQARPIHGS